MGIKDKNPVGGNYPAIGKILIELAMSLVPGQKPPKGQSVPDYYFNLMCRLENEIDLVKEQGFDAGFDAGTKYAIKGFTKEPT